MASEISSSSLQASSTDELRLRNHRNLVEQKNRLELRELDTKHDEDVQKLMSNQTIQLENLKHDYEVRFSEESEALEEKLRQIRAENEKRIEQEKANSEDELNKLKIAHQQQRDEMKKNSETQTEILKKQFQAYSNTLHEQVRKLAQKEKPHEK